MCAVSMIGDHYRDLWKDRLTQQYKPTQTGINMPFVLPPVTREEFDILKREVENMKKLLIRAKIYDEQNNEPNCEMDAKVALLKQIAKAVGVDLEEIFGKQTSK